jgi:hypothetical protein
MKTLATILAGAALALTGSAVAAKGTLAEQGEAKLARMIDGRVAGEPVQCISAMASNRIQVIEYVGLVYDAGDTVYVARATDPRSLGRWDVPIIDRFGSQLCTTDVIRTVDRTGGYFTGAVFLQDFVPYSRAD